MHNALITAARAQGRKTGCNGRPISAATRAFAARLSVLVRQSALTQKAIAARLGYERPSTLCHVLHGNIRFPLRHSAALADALGLAGADRERFLDEVWASVHPPRTAIQQPSPHQH